MSQKCHRYHKIYVLFCICWQFTHTHTSVKWSKNPSSRKPVTSTKKNTGSTTTHFWYHLLKNLSQLYIWVFPKFRGTPKWMVYNGKPYKSMDDLGENPIFSETPTYTHIELYTLPDIGLVREFVRVWHPAITFASKK